MYLGKKKHILSIAIMMVAIIKTLAALFEGGSRMMLDRKITAPDMLNDAVFSVQILSSVCQLFLISVIFLISWARLKHYTAHIAESDMPELGYLQDEYLHGHHSELSVDNTGSLLQVWAVILIGAELIYDFSSLMYKEFISLLLEALSSGSGVSDGTFSRLYNMTHGFKYLEMITALMLGIVLTGIFLKDRLLKFLPLVVTVVFLISFGLLEMQSVTIMGKEVGIVWSSLIYHITETAGLFILSIYLVARHKGI